MPRYLTELVGTYFLVLTIGMTLGSGPVVGPLAVGTVLTVLVYMGGHVSGAHYNPAVSLALLLRGVFPSRDLPGYLVAQVGGAALAALTVALLTGATFAPAPAAEASLGAVVAGEFLFSFLLVLVILHVATAPDLAGNGYYGVAIGLTVMAGAYVMGPLTSAVFNPAVAAGPILVDAALDGGPLTHLGLYVVTPVLGGAAALGVYRVQVPAPSGVTSDPGA